MITIKIDKKNNNFYAIEVKGHANSADYGKDLICAGVSCITFGLLDALDSKKIKFKEEVKEGYFYLNILQPNDVSNMMMETAYLQLSYMQKNYSEFIRIRK